MAETKIICDTDVMIDYFDARKPRHIKTKSVLEEKIGVDNVLLSAISKMELIAGTANKTEFVTINKKLDRFGTLLIDPAITNYL